MPIRTNEAEEYLSKAWETAFINGKVEFDFSTLENGVIYAARLYVALANYRMSCKRHKLKPWYATQYERILKLELIRESLTKLVIRHKSLRRSRGNYIKLTNNLPNRESL